MKKSIHLCLPVLLLLVVLLLAGCGSKQTKSAEDYFVDLAGSASLTTASNDTGTVYLYDFGTDTTLSCVRILWKDLDSSSHVFEYSADGSTWTALETCNGAPEESTSVYTFDPVTARYFRLTVNGGEGIDSLACYAENPWDAVLAALSCAVETDSEGRYLALKGLPEGISADFLGCDLEQVVDDDTRVQDTLQDKTVTVSWRLTYDGWEQDTGDYTVTIPKGTEEEAGDNACPAILPSPQEWLAGSGTMALTSSSRILVEGSDADLSACAQTLQSYLTERAGITPEIVSAESEDEAEDGDIYLCYSDETSLGEEGYRIYIEDHVTITAPEKQGLLWGCVSLSQMAAGSTSLPKGQIRDYPTWSVRGFEIDAARKPISLHMLLQIAENLSWYKMNELTVHLSDNEILGYSGKTDSVEDALTAYSAFRLESSVEGLTSTDLSWSAEDFDAFVDEAAAYGVEVIPEIESPAHSLAIVKTNPDLGLTSSVDTADQLDLSREETTSFVLSLWDEQLSGALSSCGTVGIGGDEYYGDADDYLNFENTLISHLSDAGKSIRLWASLGAITGSTTVAPRDNLSLLFWNAAWADAQDLYDDGYSLINARSDALYIISGGGYDYLDKESFYESFQVNSFPTEDGSDVTLPVWSDQLQGAELVLWNDMCGNIDIGICELDIFDRVFDALPAASEKFWGTDADLTYEEVEARADTLSYAPGSNPYDTPEEEVITSDFPDLVGPDYTVEFDLTLNEDPGEDAVLFEAARDGQTYAFKLTQGDSGKAGFSREGYDYTFDYSFPVGQTVHVTITGTLNHTTLSIDGEEVSSLGSDTAFEEHATFLFPLETIHTDIATVENLTVTASAD